MAVFIIFFNITIRCFKKSSTRNNGVSPSRSKNTKSMQKEGKPWSIHNYLKKTV